MTVTNDNTLSEALGDIAVQTVKVLPEDGRNLIKQAGLIDSDIHEDDALMFFVCRAPRGALMALFGLSIRGHQAYLRSLVVDPARRGEGLGRRLVRSAEALAHTREVTEIWLMTDTAEEFFRSSGFVSRSRDAAPAIVTDTAQFQHLCPGSAVVMVKSPG